MKSPISYSIKNLVFYTLIIVLTPSLAIAQNGQYNIRFNNYYIAASKLYVDIEIAAAYPNSEFYLSDQYYMFSYDNTILNNPSPYEGMGLPDGYMQHQITVDPTTAVATYFVGYESGNGYFLSTNYTKVGTIVFNYLAPNSCVNLIWETSTLIEERINDTEFLAYGNEFNDLSCYIPSNTSPIAVSDTAYTAEQTPIIIDVVANDSDVEDGSPLDACNVMISTQPYNGMAYWSPNCGLTYQPYAGFFGMDSFEYSVCDFEGACATAIVIIYIEEACLLSASVYINNDNACHGDMNGSATAFAFNGNEPYVYIWDNGETSPTAFTLNAGLHSLTVSDANDCIISTSIALSEPSQLNVTVATEGACNGQSDGTATATVTGGTSPYTYEWSNGAYTAMTTGLATGSYYLIVTDANGCTASNEFTIVNSPLPTANAGEDNFICQGSSVLLGGNAGAPTGPAGANYAWSPPTDLDDAFSSNPLASPPFSTTYTVLVEKDGCSITDDILIEVLPSPSVDAGEDQTLCVGSSQDVLVGGPGNNPFATYQWTPIEGISNPNSSNTYANPEQTTTYTLCASRFGCTSCEEVIVEVENCIEAIDITYYTLPNTQLNSNIIVDNYPIADCLIAIPQNLSLSFGTLTLLSDGSLEYNSYPDTFGIDVFDYEVCACNDPSLCDQATITINVAEAGRQEPPKENECGCEEEGADNQDCSATGNMPPPARFIELYQNAKITRPNIEAPWSTYINSYTGNFVVMRNDMQIMGQGEHLNASFTYNNGSSAKNFGYGNGWTFHHNLKIEQEGNDLIIRRGDGRKDRFTFDGTAYLAPNYLSDTLIDLGSNTYELHTKFGTQYAFENASHWRCTKVTDRNENVTTLTYEDSLVTEITDAYGRYLRLEYQNGLLSKLIDDNYYPPRIFEYQYDGNRNLRKVFTPDGHRWEYAYDKDRNIIQVQNKRGHYFDIEYYENSAVHTLKSSFIDMEVIYDLSNEKTIVEEQVNGSTQTTHYLFDSQGRVTQSGQGCCDFELQYAYDTNDNIVSMTDALGNEHQYFYDAKGNPIMEVDPNQDTLQLSYSSDFAQMSSMTDKGGNYSWCEFDNFGNATNIHFPMNISEEFTFENDGNISSHQNRNENTTNYQYDDFGNRKLSTFPIGAEQTVYNKVGYLMEVTDANNNTTSYDNNWMGLPTKITNPLGHETRYTYDANGNTTQILNAKNKATTMQYDALNRMVQETRPLGSIYQYKYDEKGNLLEQIDPKGKKWVYSYDQRNRRVSEKNPSNYSRFMTYDPNGKLLTSSDFKGNVDSYSYDKLGREIGSEKANGRTVERTYNKNGKNVNNKDSRQHNSDYQYDALGRLTKSKYVYGEKTMKYDRESNLLEETDELGNTVAYAYDAMNRIDSAYNALGDFMLYEYDLVGNQTMVTDFNGNSSRYFYNSLNQLDSITDAIGNTSRFRYDKNGNQTHLIDANGNTTIRYYDDLDRLIKVDAPIGSMEYTYDDNGNQTAVRDANWYTTHYLYDDQNRVQEIRHPDKSTITYTYDENGNALTTTNEEGETTTYTYDEMNQIASMTSAEGEITEYDYDQFGNQSELRLPNGNNIRYRYDHASRLIESKDNEGLLVAYRYDNKGNLTTTIDGNGNRTEQKYDELDRPFRTIDAMGDSSLVFYDKNSNVIRHIDRNNKETNITYDPLNRQLIATDAMGFQTTSNYDKLGNLQSLTDANNNATEYAYDANNRLTKETYADGTTKEFSYDEYGNRLSRKDNNGDITYYAYDIRHRLVERIYPDANNDYFSFDKLGRMKDASNNNSTITYSYDQDSRLLSETLNGQTTAYTYDIPNNTRTLTYPSGKQIVEQLDSRSRLQNISENGNTLAIYNYDLGNRPTSRTYANGTQSSYGYNDNNWVSNLSHHKGSNNFVDFSYTHDKEGNKLTANKNHHPSSSETYGYDDNYRVIDFNRPNDNKHFNYDALGNRKTVYKNGVLNNDYFTNEMNEYDEISGEGQLYDANGNLYIYTSLYFPAAAYEYDYENRIKEVHDFALGYTVLRASYQYDPLGRRIQKLVVNANTTNFYYDGARVIEEQDANNNTEATYIYGTWIDDILVMHRNNENYFYHKNALGSVVAITNDNGDVAERYEYAAYGGPEIYNGNYASLNASQIGNPYLFTGRRLDRETRLYYYRARYYDFDWGRFIQRDPLGYVDGMGLYEYVGGDGVNYTDPFGMAKWKWQSQGELNTKKQSTPWRHVGLSKKDKWRGFYHLKYKSVKNNSPKIELFLKAKSVYVDKKGRRTASISTNTHSFFKCNPENGDITFHGSRYLEDKNFPKSFSVISIQWKITKKHNRAELQIDTEVGIGTGKFTVKKSEGFSGSIKLKKPSNTIEAGLMIEGVGLKTTIPTSPSISAEVSYSQKTTISYTSSIKKGEIFTSAFVCKKCN